MKSGDRVLGLDGAVHVVSEVRFSGMGAQYYGACACAPKFWWPVDKHPPVDKAPTCLWCIRENER